MSDNHIPAKMLTEEEKKKAKRCETGTRNDSSCRDLSGYVWVYVEPVNVNKQSTGKTDKKKTLKEYLTKYNDNSD